MSPRFEVAPAAARAAPMLADAVSFFRSQRDGADVPPGPLGRKPSHLRDAGARVYAPPRYRAGRLVSVPRPLGGRVDVSGGWADAGDYLKFVTTTSYADIHLLLAARGPAADVGSVRTEALFGADWLDRMWDADSETLYFQVGLGDGGRPGGEPVLGDHDRWRLPQYDDRIDARPGDPAWFLGHRPAFRAGPPGSPVSPNLAGRLVAVFALRAQLEAESGDTDSALRRLREARALFALARTRDVLPLTTTTPRSYYVEDEWRDDLELGATELVLADLALGAEAPERWLRADLRSAARWARAYLDSPFHGFFTLARDDVSALAHADLVRGLEAARGAVPAAYLRALPVRQVRPGRRPRRPARRRTGAVRATVRPHRGRDAGDRLGARRGGDRAPVRRAHPRAGTRPLRPGCSVRGCAASSAAPTPGGPASWWAAADGSRTARTTRSPTWSGRTTAPTRCCVARWCPGRRHWTRSAARQRGRLLPALLQRRVRHLRRARDRLPRRRACVRLVRAGARLHRRAPARARHATRGLSRQEFGHDPAGDPQDRHLPREGPVSGIFVATPCCCPRSAWSQRLHRAAGRGTGACGPVVCGACRSGTAGHRLPVACGRRRHPPPPVLGVGGERRSRVGRRRARVGVPDD